MNNELLLLIKKHTDTLIEQTKTKPQETLEFVMNQQKQTYSFNPPINLVEEGKWLIGVSSFDCKNSVFNITNENSSFSITIPGHSETEFDRNTIAKIKKLKDLRSLELHVQEVRKRGDKKKTGDNDFKLSDFDTQKKRDTWRIKNREIQWSWRFSLQNAINICWS